MLIPITHKETTVPEDWGYEGWAGFTNTGGTWGFVHQARGA